jgi:hypothetical protein
LDPSDQTNDESSYQLLAMINWGFPGETARSYRRLRSTYDNNNNNNNMSQRKRHLRPQIDGSSLRRARDSVVCERAVVVDRKGVILQGLVEARSPCRSSPSSRRRSWNNGSSMRESIWIRPSSPSRVGSFSSPARSVANKRSLIVQQLTYARNSLFFL